MNRRSQDSISPILCYIQFVPFYSVESLTNHIDNAKKRLYLYDEFCGL